MKSKFPKVNFIGNKEKVGDWITSNFQDGANSVFDAFSGGCSISYKAKEMGYKVISNDVMKVNYHLAKAIIQNNKYKLDSRDVEKIFSGRPQKGFIYKNYSEVYFYPEECMQLDQYWKNIDKLINNTYKKSLAFSLLRRAMIRKRPYSRFNVLWKKVVQLRNEEYSYKHYKRKRAYHNESFKTHFLKELDTYNLSVFCNGQKNKAFNKNIFDVIDKVEADIIYLDPPYPGTMNDYYSFYGFLDEFISQKNTKPFSNSFTDRSKVKEEFNYLFSKSQNYKHLLLSLNSKSYPDKETMLKLLKKYFTKVELLEKDHNYQITGRNNKTSNKEYLFKASR